MIGEKFNKLKVQELTDQKHKGEKVWKCKCDCGEFTFVRTSYLTSGHTKSCGCLKNKKAYNNKYVGKMSGLFWSHIIHSAKNRNIQVNITPEEAYEIFEKQNGKCYYTGIELYFPDNWKKPSENKTASLDRIDSSRPYEKNNIQWIHKTVNLMKRTLSDEEFLYWCKLITNHMELNKCHSLM